jgi:AcrR family transcriptional regulator
LARDAQKSRTRAAILAAARALMAEGRSPTPPEAADRAGVSRATAYRYFADARALAVEAALDAEVATEAQILGAARDPRDRALRVFAHLWDLTERREAEFRRYLGALLTAPPGAAVTRGRRRVALYAAALAPAAARLAPADLRRLTMALAGVSGVEALVALRDACGLTPDEARATAETQILALLDRYLPLAPAPGAA